MLRIKGAFHESGPGTGDGFFSGVGIGIATGNDGDLFQARVAVEGRFREAGWADGRVCDEKAVGAEDLHTLSDKRGTGSHPFSWRPGQNGDSGIFKGHFNRFGKKKGIGDIVFGDEREQFKAFPSGDLTAGEKKERLSARSFKEEGQVVHGSRGATEDADQTPAPVFEKAGTSPVGEEGGEDGSSGRGWNLGGETGQVGEEGFEEKFPLMGTVDMKMEIGQKKGHGNSPNV